MKSIKSIKSLSLFVGLLGLAIINSSVFAQEYDDMYFNKSDRKTVQVKTSSTITSNNPTYKDITESTEAYSAKNVNPEYIARYKSSESNEVKELSSQTNDSYSSKDYFVEDYDDSYIGDSDKNNIDYNALALRDKMSYSNYNRSYSSPAWRFSPYMNFGYGYPLYGYGYDPFMMGYGSGLSFGMSYGFGSGFYPSMAYSIGMSWGTGYNPWSGWGGYYPGYYSPYGMGGFYDPWGPSYGYYPYSRFGYSPYYGGYGYGGFYPSVIVVNNSGSEYINGRNIQYKSRIPRSTATPNYSRTSSENLRSSSSDAKIRVPSRDISTNSSNGRVSRDYSKVQNEYYSRTRRSTSSANRISTNSGNSYSRSSTSTSRYNSSSINSNRPSRVSGYSSSGINRSNTYRSNSSSSGYNRSSSNSYSTPNRSSSSGFSGGSSYSSGSSGSSRSSYSSGSSSSSGSRSSGGSSRSGGRQ